MPCQCATARSAIHGADPTSKDRYSSALLSPAPDICRGATQIALSNKRWAFGCGAASLKSHGHTAAIALDWHRRQSCGQKKAPLRAHVKLHHRKHLLLQPDYSLGASLADVVPDLLMALCSSHVHRRLPFMIRKVLVGAGIQPGTSVTESACRAFTKRFQHKWG